MSDNNLFGNQKIDDITGEDALKLLVGEEAKYKTVEDLAKAALHGQQHITTIEEENQQLRDQVAKSKTVDELLAQIKAGGNERAAAQQELQDNQDHDHSAQAPSSVDIDALLERKLADREASLKAKQNKDLVVKSLLEKYGNSADSVYRSVGKSLNVDLDKLSESSPQAVLNLIQANATTGQANSGLSGGYNRDQGKSPARHALSKKAIQARYDAGEIKLQEKHRLEYEGVRQLGNAFWDD